MHKAWFWWLAIGVWVVLLFLIKRSFEFGGNPIFFFLVMLALFFLVLFFLRIAILRLRLWWLTLKRHFAAFRRPR
jgi:hypothetical protein